MNRELYDALAEYVTPHKQELFARVVAERTRWLTVVLEDVFQPHNMSACLRSCECFGIQDVHVIETYNPFEVNVDVALGAFQWLTVHRTSFEEQSITQRLTELKQQGYRLVGTSPHAEHRPLNELDLGRKTALVFGAEKAGLSETAQEMVDECIAIPMVGMTESMNVSVALAVCLYALTERLRASEFSWQLSPEEQHELQLTWMHRVVKKHWPRLEQTLCEQFPELTHYQ